uniref:Putative secreted protein n=1 Tax=Anopheles triannulatus TaxID=58253 RepID=A0A2M4B2F8_9DIPT
MFPGFFCCFCLLDAFSRAASIALPRLLLNRGARAASVSSLSSSSSSDAGRWCQPERVLTLVTVIRLPVTCVTFCDGTGTLAVAPRAGQR